MWVGVEGRRQVCCTGLLGGAHHTPGTVCVGGGGGKAAGMLYWVIRWSPSHSRCSMCGWGWREGGNVVIAHTQKCFYLTVISFSRPSLGLKEGRLINYCLLNLRLWRGDLQNFPCIEAGD